MAIDLKKLLELLEFKDHRIDELKKTIVASWDNPKKLRLITDQQCEFREQTHCYSCSNESDCSVLDGIVYLHLGEIETAIKELETANLHFLNQDETWNHIISLALIGEAHARNKKNHRALRQFEKADDAIELFEQIHSTEYIEDLIYLKKVLKDVIDALSDRETMRQQNTESQVTLPWTPTYTKLQPSPNGPIWVEDLPESKNTFVTKIILDESSYAIYSLKQDEKIIALIKGRKYGWAKVLFDSMNGVKPTPILENDFVLFYESNTADNNAIVIAACSDGNKTSYQYVVKRYSQSTQTLVSETEPPNRYAPMPIDDKVRIIGIVIAVAKASN